MHSYAFHSFIPSIHSYYEHLDKYILSLAHIAFQITYAIVKNYLIFVNAYTHIYCVMSFYAENLKKKNSNW